MERPALGALFLHFLVLAFLAVGGAPTILPGLHRYVVEAHQWLTSPQFADAYALAQVAPGPNAMYIPLIGWLVAGWGGAAVAMLALLGPASTLTLLVGRLNARHPHAPFGHAIRRGLAPITIGLMLASGWVLAQSVNHDGGGYLLTLGTVGLVLCTRWHPLWLIAVGALAGLAGLV
jgi:chromate transporter